MIEDREYLKRELARIYSPHTREVKSAMKKLRSGHQPLSGAGGGAEADALEP